MLAIALMPEINLNHTEARKKKQEKKKTVLLLCLVRKSVGRGKERRERQMKDLKRRQEGEVIK